MTKESVYENFDEVKELLNVSDWFLKILICKNIIKSKESGKRKILIKKDIPFFIGINDVAKIIGKSPRTIRRYIDDKILEHYVFRNDKEFALKDIESFIVKSKK
ncbi:MAG: hypothetical protein ACOCRX_04475 [Candidatus Woesearchaeota archaeon]